MDFFTRLSNLCEEQGTTITALCKTLKISTSKRTAWSKGSMPSADVLIKLSNHFGVSIDYLLKGIKSIKPEHIAIKNYIVLTIILQENTNTIHESKTDMEILSKRLIEFSQSQIYDISTKLGVSASYFNRTHTIIVLSAVGKAELISKFRNLSMEEMIRRLNYNQNFEKWIRIGVFPNEGLLKEVVQYTNTYLNDNLEYKNLIDNEETRLANIRLSEIAQNALTSIPKYRIVEPNEHSVYSEKTNATFLNDMKVHLVPLYESVSAGFGALAQDYIADYVPLFFVSEHEAAETLCLRVEGDSMHPKIENGDIVQVQKQDEAENNNIVVALVTDDTGAEEGFVKRFICGNDYIELQSINPMYPTKRFEKEKMRQVKILGVVKKIIKSV